MTAKSKPEPIEPSHEAETEKPVIGETKPQARLDATQIADALTLLDGDYHDGLDAFVGASASGNRLTISVIDAETNLVQTFYATVEEGIREF